MSYPNTRRTFLKGLAGGAAVMTASTLADAGPRPLLSAQPGAEEIGAGNRPNLILLMSDDQGYADTGYYGHPHLKTPHLDAMAAAGLRFDRFYAAAPVCSPTRGSCMTGRHPSRYGIWFANAGHLPAEEVTLAEALKTRGYVTGHFGKWHLGTLTKTEKDSNRGGPRGVDHYAPPWEHGFDVCFSTEAKVPTLDPMQKPRGGGAYGTAYWTGEGKKAMRNLEGDDSRVIMDRAIPFIRDAAAAKRPFLAVVWFHTPHEPVLAGPEHLALYAHVPNEKARHYFGCLTAMDEQIGRLRGELRRLGVAGSTVVWFASDNGPEHKSGPGSAGPLRGRKRSLFEGGVRVPGLLEWPDRVRPGRRTDVPCVTSDYYPTVLDALGLKAKGQPEPLDGLSLMPLLEGKMAERPRRIAFQSRDQLALSGNRHKLVSTDGGKTWMLFDLAADPGERTDLAAEKPKLVAEMRAELEAWSASCERSAAGQDYRA